MNLCERVALAAVTVLLTAGPSEARPPDADAMLADAGRSIEAADRAHNMENWIVAISSWQRALEKVREADALAPGDREIVVGMREIELSLAEAWMADSGPSFAWDVLHEMLESMRSRFAAGVEGGSRLQQVRGLRLFVDASFRTGKYLEGRSALAELVDLSRDLRAEDPANLYLTRKLAEDLADEAFIRLILGDAEGTIAAAAEMLELSRALAEASPDSGDAQSNYFVWMFRNAEFNEDPGLYRATLALGDDLERRGLLRDRDHYLLDVTREWVANAERRGL